MTTSLQAGEVTAPAGTTITTSSSSSNHNSSTMSSAGGTGGSSANTKESRDLKEKEAIKTPSSPKIDLASFPPLPGRPSKEDGSEEGKKDEGSGTKDIVPSMTPMADVVKGLKEPKVCMGMCSICPCLIEAFIIWFSSSV